MRGILSLLLLCCVVWVTAGSHPFHWIFVHYHKTGHDLARRLADVFRSNPCSANVRYGFVRRIHVSHHIDSILATDIAVMAGADMQVAWNGSFLNAPPSHVRMVHFLRDPFDMVLSAYLYHSQDVPPGLELWLKNSHFDPCAIDFETLLNVYAIHVGEYYGDVLRITELITATMDTCNELYNVRAQNTNKGYNAALQSLSKHDGLLLEACRSILSATGGDILRMGTNALFERNTTNRNSYRVFMPEFSISNITQFTHASKRLYTYLMASDGLSEPHFWSCIDIPAAVDKSVQLAYIGKDGTRSSDSGGESKAKDTSVHVTQGLISAEDRAEMKEFLHSHPVVGPLLSVVQHILLDK